MDESFSQGNATPSIFSETKLVMWNPSWLAARRLQSQLVAWTALILIVSVAGTSEIQTRANIRLLEQNLRDRTESVVHAVYCAISLGSWAESGFLPVDALQE